jgi:hypothetical protein
VLINNTLTTSTNYVNQLFTPTPPSAEALFFDGAIAAAVAMFGLAEQAME